MDFLVVLKYRVILVVQSLIQVRVLRQFLHMLLIKIVVVVRNLLGADVEAQFHLKHYKNVKMLVKQILILIKRLVQKKNLSKLQIF